MRRLSAKPSAEGLLAPHICDPGDIGSRLPEDDRAPPDAGQPGVAAVKPTSSKSDHLARGT